MKQMLKNVNWLGWAQALLVFALILAPVTVSAAKLTAPSGLCATGLNCEDNLSINGIIIRIINWILAIVLAVDVLMIIIGGFMYVTSAGDEGRAKKGRTTVVNAIIGLVIIILAYVIANVVSNFFSADRLQS